MNPNEARAAAGSRIGTLQIGAILAGIGGAALFVSMFLSWFEDVGVAGVSTRSTEAADFLGIGGATAADATQDAWQSMGWFGVLVLLSAALFGISYAVVTFTELSLSAPI